MADAVQVFDAATRVTDASGNPVSGGSIEFYDAGTTTPKTVYADKDLTVVLGASVATDAGGYPVTGGSVKTLVYVGTADYKMVIKDSGGVTLITHDNIKGAPVIPSAVTVALPSTPVISKAASYTAGSGDRGKLINANPTGGAFVVTLLSAVTAGDGFRIGLRHVGTANTVAFATVATQTISRSGKASAAFALTAYGESVWLVSDGANWHVDSYVAPLLMGPLPWFAITDRLTSPPTSPTAGARYIINGTPAGAWATLGYVDKQVVEADGNGNWINYTPQDGWLAYVLDENLLTQYRDTVWTDLTNITAPNSSILGRAAFTDTRAQNTGGGTLTASAWTTATLNTTEVNAITGCSLASNQITLPAGTYRIEASKQLSVTQNSRLRLFNVTDSSVIMVSNSFMACLRWLRPRCWRCNITCRQPVRAALLTTFPVKAKFMRALTFSI
jgi:hypothetical protein